MQLLIELCIIISPNKTNKQNNMSSNIYIIERKAMVNIYLNYNV